MARRERVESANAVQSPLRTLHQQQQQQPPPADEPPAAAALGRPSPQLLEDEQLTEVSAFSPSPSPLPEFGPEMDEAAATARPPPRPSGGVAPRRSSHAAGAAGRAGRPPPGSTKAALAPVAPMRGAAELHLAGEVTGAVGFGGGACLYATWQLVYDARLWAVTQGSEKGRTHASSPQLPEDAGLSGIVWEAPLSVSLATSSAQRWPCLAFKLFSRSLWLGRDEFVGYGLCSLPTSPGCHHVSCPVWSVVDARRAPRQEVLSWFTGLSQQLVDEGFVTGVEQRYEQGQQHLQTRDAAGGAGAASPAAAWAHALAGPHAPAAPPGGRSMERLDLGVAPAAELRCRSFAGASAGGSAAPGAGHGAGSGGRICLRVHVVFRGLGQLRHTGGESVGRCLERLRSSVEKVQRQQQGGIGRLAGRGEEEEDGEESEGLRLVREGRGARLAAAQQQLDGERGRDQGGRARSASVPSSGMDEPPPGSRLHSWAGGATGAGGGGGGGAAGPASARGRSGLGGPSAADGFSSGGGGSPSRFSRAGQLGAGNSSSGSGRTASPQRVSPEQPLWTGGSSAPVGASAAALDSGGRRTLGARQSGRSSLLSPGGRRGAAASLAEAPLLPVDAKCSSASGGDGNG